MDKNKDGREEWVAYIIQSYLVAGGRESREDAQKD